MALELIAISATILVTLSETVAVAIRVIALNQATEINPFLDNDTLTIRFAFI